MRPLPAPYPTLLTVGLICTLIYVTEFVGGAK